MTTNPLAAVVVTLALSAQAATNLTYKVYQDIKIRDLSEDTSFIKFNLHETNVIEITPDGRVHLADGLNLDDASKFFWKTITDSFADIRSRIIKDYLKTNTIAQITTTLITNVVPSDNGGFKEGLVQHGDMIQMERYNTPATESYLTTNVTEHTTVTVTLSDGPHTFTYDRLLSSVTAILKKQETWKAEGLRTNSVAIEQNGQWSILQNIIIDNGATNIWIKQ